MAGYIWFPIKKETYQWFLRNWPSGNFRVWIGSHTGHVKRPGDLAIANPSDIRVVKPRLVLEPIHRLAACTMLITVSIHLGHHTGGLLCGTAGIGVFPGDGWVGDDHVIGRVNPGVVVVERGPLARLRDFARVIGYLSFEHIYFWRRSSHEATIWMLGTRMDFPWASTSRESLAR